MRIGGGRTLFHRECRDGIVSVEIGFNKDTAGFRFRDCSAESLFLSKYAHLKTNDSSSADAALLDSQAGELFRKYARVAIVVIGDQRVHAITASGNDGGCGYDVALG